MRRSLRRSPCLSLKRSSWFPRRWFLMICASFGTASNPLWIEQALTVTGTATLRRRRLPADQVIWLVVGMAILRNDSIERVAAALDLALPSTSGDFVARSALTQARQRLGAEPLEYLCQVTGQQWAHRSADVDRWRGLALYGLDGTTLRVPDSEANWDRFGGQPSNGERNGSAYPTVRAVALMALRSHLIAAVRFGPYAAGELTLAKEMWPEIPSRSLTIVDRGFLVIADLARFQEAGDERHWLTRARKQTRLRTIERLGPDDELVEIEMGRSQRQRTDFFRVSSSPVPSVIASPAIRLRCFSPPSLTLSCTPQKTCLRSITSDGNWNSVTTR